MKKVILPLIALGLAITIQSCKKPKDDVIATCTDGILNQNETGIDCGGACTPCYSIPTTYNFSSVDYSGQTYRLAMMTELSNEMKKANTMGVTVDAMLLNNMYTNTNSPFADVTLNTSGKQLRDKTFATQQTVIEGYLDSHALFSQSTVAGSNGTAGVVTSGTSKYLFDANGLEYTQLVDKGLLGALIYYQITAVYLGDDKMGAQVALATRQHHWDEAFGYFGVPVDFPTNTTGVKYIGKYTNDRNAVLNINAAIMNAYLKGRAALDNDDNATVTAQIAIIRDNLEKVMAGTAIHYINEALSNVSDNAIRNHTLSEAIAFVRGLNYNPTKKITLNQINEVEDFFGTNFYTVSTTDLQAAKNLLSTIYGFDAVKDQL